MTDCTEIKPDTRQLAGQGSRHPFRRIAARYGQLAQRGPDENVAWGIALFALAVLLFVGIDSSGKWLMLSGIPALSAVFIRYFVPLVLTLAFTLPRQGMGVLRSVNPRLQLARSVCLFLSTLLNFAALYYLPLSVTTSIIFTGPLCVTLLSVPLLGETVTRQQMMAIAVGFGGVLVVTHPWDAGFHWAVLLSMGAVLASSFYFILTRKLANEATATHQIWTCGVASALVLPFALWNWVWPEGWQQWMVFMLVGIFGGSAHLLVTLSHRITHASVLAPVVYLQLIFATAAGWLIFGLVPGIWVLAGGTIIALAGLWLRRAERQKHR